MIPLWMVWLWALGGVLVGVGIREGVWPACCWMRRRVRRRIHGGGHHTVIHHTVS